MNSETLLAKYQPTTLAGIHGHDVIRRILTSMVEQNNIPHMMFTGSPGNGKSTTAMALIKDLYGNDYKSNFLKISTSSEELGIDTVRGKIKDATKYKSLNYPFKIIVIEEADGLSPQAQFAFREIMLKNQQITRFILICNNLNKIIPPIQDRCQIFRFAQLRTDDITEHMKSIVSEEDIQISSSQISTIAELADGSMRNAVNTLQTVATQDTVTDDLIKTLMGARLRSEYAEKVLEAVYDNNQNGYESEIFNLVYKEGFTPEEIMQGIIDVLISKNNPKLIKQITLLAEYDFRMSQGQNKLLQLRCGLSRLASIRK